MSRGDVASLAQKLADSQAEVESLQAAQVESARQYELLQQELIATQAELQAVKAVLEETSRRYDEIVPDLLTARGQIEFLKSALEKADRRHHDAQGAAAQQYRVLEEKFAAAQAASARQYGALRKDFEKARTDWEERYQYQERENAALQVVVDTANREYGRLGEMCERVLGLHQAFHDNLELLVEKLGNQD
ncbi:hypothetical protein C6495_18965 [Candidatus Poribacteria bacterium]|nr:MAG: hypothetical protein C6495_18965 [Candidatus Poribacteria bacterium]